MCSVKTNINFFIAELAAPGRVRTGTVADPIEQGTRCGCAKYEICCRRHCRLYTPYLGTRTLSRQPRPEPLFAVDARPRWRGRVPDVVIDAVAITADNCNGVPAR